MTNSNVQKQAGRTKPASFPPECVMYDVQAILATVREQSTPMRHTTDIGRWAEENNRVTEQRLRPRWWQLRYWY